MTMTESGTAVPETGPASTEADETPEGGTPSTPEAENGAQGLVEARDRYRGERDAARVERDALASRVQALQRSEVERLVSEHLAVPADFWISENAVSDYLTESGEVDVDRVTADAKLLLTERPRLGKHAGAFDPSQGLGGNTPPPKGPTWGALLH